MTQTVFDKQIIDLEVDRERQTGARERSLEGETVDCSQLLCR